jgi:drug/metabolite transporter (DMT)-like permease
MTAAVVTLALGEAVIARGMKQAGAAESTGWWSFATQAIGNPWVIGGATLLGLHLLLYATAMSRADLSLVMPITAVSYPLVTLLSRFFLHEEVNLTRWVGTSIIALGVAVVAWGEASSAK